ncbi:hypothetical protein T484DRAFT_1758513 [Baffinella frigidus]|nr:hypothetical protein T484DRAFT_1758513 [Cryptophyta sp. CCMP2293]
MNNIDCIVDSIMTSFSGNAKRGGSLVDNDKHPLYGTKILKMDMNDRSQFMPTKNYGRGGDTRSDGIEWITATPDPINGHNFKVGVMIASNMGRPGGSCYRPITNSYAQFIPIPAAPTQEESVLSFIQMRARDKTSILNGLNELQLYAMSYPIGDDSDFNVARTPSQIKASSNGEPNFNVNTSDNAADYAREFGFDVTVDGIATRKSRSSCHNIYLSFVAGPNASDPVPGAIDRGLSLQPRKNKD